ncbi:MAG: O-antigen ligase family protein, partial [Patescibacteria group bacterium]
GRNFAFRILVELALVLWVGLMVADKRYRPRSNLMLWAVTIFTIIVGIANLQGVNPYGSFWSGFERMEGYLMILHLFAYFLVITNVFKTKKDWLTFFNLFVIAGLLVGSYAVLQVLGFREAIQGGGVRFDGTIGNPTYLAAYLVLIGGLALVLLFNAVKRWQKYFYSGVLIFNLIILYFTASRGAAIALLISIPIFLLLYIFLVRDDGAKEKLFKKIAIVGLILLILIPLGFLLIKKTKLVKESDVLSRFANLSFVERTVRARVYIWQMSWAGFKERPLLGWGQDNYIQVFSKYFNPKMYDQEPWFDRPHNIIFEWLINAGILGLIAYLSMFVALYVLVINAWRKKKINTKEGIVLVMAPLAYFLQNLFVFDNFNTYILFFALLGYASFLDKSADEAFEKSPVIQRVRPSLIIVAVLFAIMLIIGYFINIKPMKVARGIITSLQATVDSTDPINKTKSMFQKTLDYKTFGEREALEQLTRIATTLANQSVNQKIKKDFLDFTEPRVEDYLRRFPNDIRMRLFAGALYNAATEVDRSYILKARGHIEVALTLSPTKQQVLYMLADNYLRTSEIEKAMELLEKAYNLEPFNIEALANKAVVAVIVGRSDVVMESIARMQQIRLAVRLEEKGWAFGEFIQGLARIGRMYIAMGDSRNAYAIFEQLVILKPDEKVFVETFESLKQ